jgi:hypothetical protein
MPSFAVLHHGQGGDSFAGECEYAAPVSKTSYGLRARLFKPQSRLNNDVEGRVEGDWTALAL